MQRPVFSHLNWSSRHATVTNTPSILTLELIITTCYIHKHTTILQRTLLLWFETILLKSLLASEQLAVFGGIAGHKNWVSGVVYTCIYVYVHACHARFVGSLWLCGPFNFATTAAAELWSKWCCLAMSYIVLECSDTADDLRRSTLCNPADVVWRSAVLCSRPSALYHTAGVSNIIVSHGCRLYLYANISPSSGNPDTQSTRIKLKRPPCLTNNPTKTPQQSNATAVQK